MNNGTNTCKGPFPALLAVGLQYLIHPKCVVIVIPKFLVFLVASIENNPLSSVIVEHIGSATPTHGSHQRNKQASY